MSETLTPKERLIIVKALRDSFTGLLRSKKSTKWAEAVEVYDLANRVRRDQTGRPEKTWAWHIQNRPGEHLRDFDTWVEDLGHQISQLQGSAKLASSLTSEKKPVSRCSEYA